MVSKGDIVTFPNLSVDTYACHAFWSVKAKEKPKTGNMMGFPNIMAKTGISHLKSSCMHFCFLYTYPEPKHIQNLHISRTKKNFQPSSKMLIETAVMKT